MEKPEQYTLLVPQFPRGPWTGSLADARNSLVQQALDGGLDDKNHISFSATLKPHYE